MIDHHEHVEAAVHADVPLVTFQQPTLGNSALLAVLVAFCAYQLWAYWKETKK